MEISDHITCLLRNLYAGQEAIVRIGHGTLDWFQTGKGVHVKAVYWHPAYLMYMQSTPCKMPGWLKHKLESRLPGERSITSDMQMTPPCSRKWRRTKEQSGKFGLKLNIQKTQIMASSPITSRQIDEETMEIVRDFILGGSKITADGDCSHKIKRHLLLGRKAMTNLDSILKAETLLCQQKSI